MAVGGTPSASGGRDGGRRYSLRKRRERWQSPVLPPTLRAVGEFFYVSWFSPGTGVRINQIELAMPRASVIAR